MVILLLQIRKNRGTGRLSILQQRGQARTKSQGIWLPRPCWTGEGEGPETTVSPRRAGKEPVPGCMSGRSRAPSITTAASLQSGTAPSALRCERSVALPHLLPPFSALLDQGLVTGLPQPQESAQLPIAQFSRKGQTPPLCPLLCLVAGIRL